jgi:hypothetical protein
MFVMQRLKDGEFYDNRKCTDPKKRFLAQIPCDFVLQLVIDQDFTSSNKKIF